MSARIATHGARAKHASPERDDPVPEAAVGRDHRDRTRSGLPPHQVNDGVVSRSKGGDHPHVGAAAVGGILGDPAGGALNDQHDVERLPKVGRPVVQPGRGDRECVPQPASCAGAVAPPTIGHGPDDVRRIDYQQGPEFHGASLSHACGGPSDHDPVSVRRRVAWHRDSSGARPARRRTRSFAFSTMV